MKKLLAMLLCLIMAASCLCLTACNEKEDNKNSDETKDKGDEIPDLPDYYDPFEEIGEVAPIDVSDIKPAQGGDIVGKWVSGEMIHEMMDQNNQVQEIGYNTIFIFHEDGSCEFALSLIQEEDPFKDATYTIDGANITIVGEGVNIPNATYTVDGDILLINSDTLNSAFRRVED